MTENYAKSLRLIPKKLLTFGNCLVNYLQFVRLVNRKVSIQPLDESIHNLPYFEYTKMRRNPKLKVVSHFKEDGPTIQKVIEELLLEVVVVK